MAPSGGYRNAANQAATQAKADATAANTAADKAEADADAVVAEANAKTDKAVRSIKRTVSSQMQCKKQPRMKS